MFKGPVFRRFARDMRSILSWLAEAKEVLPKTIDSDGPKGFVEWIAGAYHSFALHEYK